MKNKWFLTAVILFFIPFISFARIDGDIDFWSNYPDEELADAVETLQGSINDVQRALNNYVPKTRKVNGKSLDADVTITLTELGGETPSGAQAKADAALAAAKSDAADKVSAATEAITGAYQAADTTLSNRIKAIEQFDLSKLVQAE